MRALVIKVAPRIEPGGYHRDRFDAFLGGELLHTGRQVIRPVARILLERGYAPDTLLTAHALGASGASFVPRTIAEWASEKLVETSRDGFRVEMWAEHPLGNAPRSTTIGGQDARDGSGRGVA